MAQPKCDPLLVRARDQAAGELRMVARLTAAEIARAFLVHTLTMEQRSAARSGSPSWHFGASR